jgi:hypothetical protein
LGVLIPQTIIFNPASWQSSINSLVVKQISEATLDTLSLIAFYSHDSYTNCVTIENR